MRFAEAASLRQMDQAAEKRLPPLSLMLRAGREVAHSILRLVRLCEARRVVCVAGRGNNGGDAMIAARILQESGMPVVLLLACSVSDLKGDARLAFRWMREGDVPWEQLPDETCWQDALSHPSLLCSESVVVDGLLGTGCSRPPGGTLRAAIDWMQIASARNKILSIDLPSGMVADTGDCPGSVVCADWTVSLCLPKTGFLSPASWPKLGHLSVSEIGMPDAIQREALAVQRNFPQLLAASDVHAFLPPRHVTDCKHALGRMAIVGGSVSFPHAPVFSAMGAFAMGAALVTLCVPDASRPAAASWSPEATFCRADSLGSFLPLVDVLVCGPGMGRDEVASSLFSKVIRSFPGRLVLDADALYFLAKNPEMVQNAPSSQQRILTPHLGEAARLAACSVEDLQTNLSDAARFLAMRYQSTVVLKGHPTWLFGWETDDGLWVNLTGNPGMAVGGMGDLLAGMIGACWVQQPKPLSAAAAAVWAHACAGDFSAIHTGQLSLTPRSLLSFLPLAQRMGGMH